MKLDSSDSLSAAGGTGSFQNNGNNRIPKVESASRSGKDVGRAIEEHTYPNGEQKEKCRETDTSWSYLFVHNQKVRSIERQLKKDHCTHFIHKTVKYISTPGRKDKIQRVTVPSVSGLIFLQGDSQRIQAYLNDKFSHYRLCKDYSTGGVAKIPNSQMEPFMRIAEIDPGRIRFLLHPFYYYSKNRVLLRIVSGEFAGLEGYVVRIARDRRLVMDIGGMSVAVAGVHAERFEEVGKNEADKRERKIFYKRNLQERNAFIDRYFHKVKSKQEVVEQIKNIEMLRLQTLADVEKGKSDVKDACEIFYFMIEEIGYYYAPFIDSSENDLLPVFEAGKKVIQEINHLIVEIEDEKIRQRYEREYEELTDRYGYLYDL